ncbi:MAG: PIG-L family deacetylase [Albidovulum sp.]|nr:PIG-L family deacetylase [Albidovulum sp.]
MPTDDQIRIAEDKARPRVMELWRALRPLRSVIRFMNTGAHPDDETTSMLAALRMREGFSVSFACATRGDGGQNEVGTELTTQLAALRTVEMERASDALGMRLYWLSESPGDSIADFGFSKNGADTLSRWGRERTLARLVEIVRTERPDIICPTFLDVPGQHGHHRAMTEMAQQAFSAAASNEFPSELPPWEPRKLYLPAWSGAGRSYDDDEPPPATTLLVSGRGSDPVSGWSWQRIGQQSRAFHRSQGMGRWVPAGEERDWPLHLVESRVDGPDRTLASGLSDTVADLGDIPGAESIGEELRAAGAAIESAISAYPDFRTVARTAIRALGHVRAARAACPEAVRGEIDHRLGEKEIQLGHAIRIALGVEVRGRVDRTWLRPGESANLELEIFKGDADGVDLKFDFPYGVEAKANRLLVDRAAPPTNPWRSSFDSLLPRPPALSVRIKADGTNVHSRLALDGSPLILPAIGASINPDSAIANLARTRREFEVALSELNPAAAQPSLDLPDGWSARRIDQGYSIALPEGVGCGLYSIPLLLNGKPAWSSRRIAYPHIGATATFRPAEIKVRVLAAEVPDTRVGYIGGGNDNVRHWLDALGANVAEVTDAELNSDASLDAYDALVVGIFAMRFREGLIEAVPRVKRWTEAGGTLLTLYHRPWDNWDPDSVPPRMLEIGQPSFRWRVADPSARVTQLVADHPVLNTPNVIGPEDWEGWRKERGLYFAKAWDKAYTPLVEMSDKGEEPLRGALLAADIGRGRHVHTSLVLHHQMDQLVPGAFRLMANLIARRE